MMNLNILLIEDDTAFRKTLKQVLETEGYNVIASGSCTDAKRVILHSQSGQAQRMVDLVILDLGLPDGDGADFLLWLKQRLAVPVLIISARNDDGSKVSLLDAGADDYLVKPFGVPELLARLRVTLRHRGNTLAAATTYYVFNNIKIDLKKRQIKNRDCLVHLTPKEFQLLSQLVRQSGQVQTHRQLLANVWGNEFVEHTHYLRLYIAQLRNKLENNPLEPCMILTETGIGYRMAEGTTTM